MFYLPPRWHFGDRFGCKHQTIGLNLSRHLVGFGSPVTHVRGQEYIWLKLTQGMAAIDWSDPERLKSLEKRYSLPDIVEQRRRFIELAKPLEGESCLDVGCGPAFLVELLKAAVGEKGSVVGVDHSEAMVQAAKVRCPSAKVLQASAEELPFPDGSFDLVTITQVVVYVADPAKALSEVKRVLKLGGRVLILDSIWSQSSWSGADVELQRRILDAYDKHCSHPLLPMRIPELLGRVGLEFADGPHVIPITNIAWDEVGFAKGASATWQFPAAPSGLVFFFWRFVGFPFNPLKFNFQQTNEIGRPRPISSSM